MVYKFLTYLADILIVVRDLETKPRMRNRNAQRMPQSRRNQNAVVR